METLAYLHLALAYEETSVEELSTIEIFALLTKLNLLTLLKEQKYFCKAWIYGLSLSLTLAPFSSALNLQLGAHGNRVSNLASNSSSKSILEKSSNSSSIKGNERTQVSSIPSLSKENKEKVLKPTQGTSSISSTSKSKSTSEVELEQTGKLRFVNDTPYIAIVSLYKPGSQQPYRYVHIPPCYQRKLLARYSNFWKVSFNSYKVSSINKISVKKGAFFEINTSKLADEKNWNNLCQNALISRPVVFNNIEIKKYYVEYKKLEKLAKDAEIDLQVYANFMTKLINKILENKFYWNNKFTQIPGADQVSEYCNLELFLKEMEKLYDKNEANFKIDGIAGLDEQKKVRTDFKIKFNKPDDNNPPQDGVEDLIRITELYLGTRNYFYRELDALSAPIRKELTAMGATLESQRSNGSPNTSIPIDSCKTRLQNVIIASVPRKKTNVC